MSVIALLGLILVSQNSQAFDTDLGINASMRTTKLSGAGEIQGGLSQVIWGTPGMNPNFGYTRLSAAFRSAGLANGYRAQLEMYPISVFGITLGRQGLMRLSNAPGIDCTRYDCSVDVASNYLQMRGVFKVSEVFGQVIFQRDIYSNQYYSLPLVFEPMNQLAISSGGDYTTTWTVVTGYEINPVWSSGIVYQHSNAENTGYNMQSELLFARYKPANTTYSLAVGRVGTTVFGVGPQVAFTLSWWPKARIGF